MSLAWSWFVFRWYSLTHEHTKAISELGKHRYEREEVKFASEEIAQHFWERLDDRTERLSQYVTKGRSLLKADEENK